MKRLKHFTAAALLILSVHTPMNAAGVTLTELAQQVYPSNKDALPQTIDLYIKAAQARANITLYAQHERNLVAIHQIATDPPIRQLISTHISAARSSAAAANADLYQIIQRLQTISGIPVSPEFDWPDEAPQIAQTPDELMAFDDMTIEEAAILVQAQKATHQRAITTAAALEEAKALYVSSRPNSDNIVKIRAYLEHASIYIAAHNVASAARHDSIRASYAPLARIGMLEQTFLISSTPDVPTAKPPSPPKLPQQKIQERPRRVDTQPTIAPPPQPSFELIESAPSAKTNRQWIEIPN
jgi:hypothetical protein